MSPLRQILNRELPEELFAPGAACFRAKRQSQGLSLSDVEQRTGIGRVALSRLENENEPNPTVTTLSRYADALAKKLVVTFD